MFYPFNWKVMFGKVIEHESGFYATHSVFIICSRQSIYTDGWYRIEVKIPNLGLV
jgi:hypothetical protein